MKKFLLVAVAIGVLVPLSGCSSPEMKVKQAEDAKNALLQSSGYNDCIAKVNAEDAAFKKCQDDELATKGYHDGIDCTLNPDNPICGAANGHYSDRYAAGVQVYNDCLPKFYMPGGVRIGLSSDDCVKLLQQ